MSQRPTQNLHLNHPMNSQNPKKIVGFDARNKDSVRNSYICQICNLLMRDPVQLLCGHRLCQSCINIEGHSIIKCIICNIDTSHDKITLDRGCQQDMKTIPILCSFCDWTDIFKHYPEHLSTHHTNSSCKHCGKEFIAMNLFIQHQSECEKMIVNCQLEPYGCTEKFLRINTKNHLLSEKHQSVMLSILSQTKPHPMNVTSNEQLKSTQMDMDLPQTMISTSISSNNRLNKTLDVLLGSVQVLNDDSQKLSSQNVHTQYSLQSLAEDLSKLKTAVQETNAFKESLKPNHQILLQDLDSFKRDIEDQQSTSYDGTYLWRITDVRKKMADAQSETHTSIYSPPFYSSPTGYKMCARLYLYGDGNARRTHISIFFVLMRGEHDAILQFPFTFKVTFCLYDQTDQQRHIIDSFRPDAKSSSFQRPLYQMNIASGIPKFFPLAILQQDNNPYIRDDTMFIKIVVHFINMPKTLLPYILGINPGLPAPIQQVMIKHETEKQVQQQAIVIQTPTTSLTKDDLK